LKKKIRDIKLRKPRGSAKSLLLEKAASYTIRKAVRGEAWIKLKQIEEESRIKRYPINERANSREW